MSDGIRGHRGIGTIRFLRKYKYNIMKTSPQPKVCVIYGGKNAARLAT